MAKKNRNRRNFLQLNEQNLAFAGVGAEDEAFSFVDQTGSNLSQAVLKKSGTSLTSGFSVNSFAAKDLQNAVRAVEAELVLPDTDGLSIFLRRMFDLVFSATVLVVLSPVYLAIAILIKVLSPEGPAVFAHTRVGKDGELFKVYKFRTMVANAEAILKDWLENNPEIKAEFEKDFKLKNDPRVIPYIGTFLRKSSLDELPQFFNVLLGNMSVVGPRPIVENEIPKYGRYAAKLHTVKPGVTGLWQVSGRNDINYDQRVALDMEYIDNQTIFSDIKIVFQTVLVMLSKSGAY